MEVSHHLLLNSVSGGHILYTILYCAVVKGLMCRAVFRWSLTVFSQLWAMAFSCKKKILDIHNLICNKWYPTSLIHRCIIDSLIWRILKWSQCQFCTADSDFQGWSEGEKTSHVCQQLQQVSFLTLCFPVRIYFHKLSIFFLLPLCCWYWIICIHCMFESQKNIFGSAHGFWARLIICFHLNISSVSTFVLCVALTSGKYQSQLCTDIEGQFHSINADKLWAIRWNEDF